MEDNLNEMVKVNESKTIESPDMINPSETYSEVSNDPSEPSEPSEPSTTENNISPEVEPTQSINQPQDLNNNYKVPVSEIANF